MIQKTSIQVDISNFIRNLHKYNNSSYILERSCEFHDVIQLFLNWKFVVLFFSDLCEYRGKENNNSCFRCGWFISMPRNIYFQKIIPMVMSYCTIKKCTVLLENRGVWWPMKSDNFIILDIKRNYDSYYIFIRLWCIQNTRIQWVI